MKSTYLIFALSFSLLFACNKENDLFKIMPESDLLALEGMDEAYDNALLYNDSLQLCYDEPSSCDSLTIAHYDEFFHQFDEMFNFHHNNYSHNNVGDDHHHENGHNVRHGGMGHNEGSGHEEDEYMYEHNLESLELMMHLREIHEGIHPE